MPKASRKRSEVLFRKKGHQLLSCALFILVLTACNFRFVPTATPTPTAAPPSPARLTVIYLENNSLYLWREGDSTPRRFAENANPPIALAPDGRHAAFTRGQDGQPQTLWVASTTESREQALVELGDIPAQRSARAMISAIAWLDATALYFSSYQAYEWGDQPDNNLYRVELGSAEQPTSDPQLILPPGAGGAFSFSPDRQQIATIYPGQYNSESGRVLILDPRGENARTALEFSAISTASEVPFYPPLYWSPDSAAVRVPIPDRSLMRNQASAPPVELWHLPVAGDSRIVGYAPAAINGLPRWSPRTGTMLYAQPSAALDMYNLFIADADGANAGQYADGGSEILAARWLDEQGRFVYARGTRLMMGEREQPPQTIAASVGQWRLAGNAAVFTSAPGGVIELRYASLDAPGMSALIAPATTDLIFDAVFAP